MASTRGLFPRLLTLVLIGLGVYGKPCTNAAAQTVELNNHVLVPILARACEQDFEVIDPDDAVNEQSIADRINAERIKFGLAPLVLAVQLTQAARLHSRDMADNNYTGHTGSDGSTPGERILRTCYLPRTYGENIGWGFGGNTDQMVDWWMNSPPHRSAILFQCYSEFGVGYTRKSGTAWGHYWTVEFARPGGAGACQPQ